MKRILAIDYGLKRIGLAITDERNVIALPLTTVLSGKSHKESIANIKRATAAYAIGSIVIGLPLLPNGKEGEMSEKVRSFAKTLQEFFPASIHFFDERFTSSKAHRSFEGMNRKKRTKLLDSTAALILLQDYLSMRGNEL